MVIDFEHPATNVGAARKLAAALGGHCYSLPELRADVLVRTVLQDKQAQQSGDEAPPWKGGALNSPQRCGSILGYGSTPH